MTELINTEIESYFLGACMVNSKVYEDSILSTTDFGTLDHQLIYAAIATVYEECQKTGPVLIADRLKKDGEINRVGGSNIIYEMQQVVVETESAVEYAKEIRRLSTKRQIAGMLAGSLAEVKELDSDPESIVANFEMRTQQLQFEKQQLESYTALELSKMEIEPVKWFIPDFLPSGLTILAGPPKIGKSFFCWNMAMAVAQGGIAFSSVIIPEAYNVSYLSLEDPPALLKDRLAMISQGEDLPNNLHIVNDMIGKKLDALGLKLLGDHLDETKSEMLIVDTWKHVTPDYNIKGTSYDIDYNALIPIQQFAHRRNISVVLVTHTRKAADIDNVFNQIQGSVGMQAACDTIMMLSHDSGAKTLHLSGRRIESQQFAFTIDQGIWKLEGAAQEYHGSELKKEILALLKEVGGVGMSTSDIIDATGKNDKTVRSTLRRMVKNSEIKQPKKRGDYFDNDEDEDEDEQIEVDF